MYKKITHDRIVPILVGAVVMSGMVGFAGSATAAEPAPHTTGAEITNLPAKATLVGGKTPAELVTVKIAVPSGFVCATDFKSRVVGQSNAVTVPVSPDCSVSGFAKWTVTANPITFERNAVVKFISTNATHSANTVGTLEVKVNPGAKPATPTAKPSATPTATPSTTGAEITKLPAKAILVGGKTPAEFVTVKIAVPSGFVCATDFKSRVVGQRNAVTVPVSPDCTIPGFAKWTVTANPITFKRNAVVKFISTNATHSANTVGTLEVKVNPGARPATPTAKPSATPKPSNTHGNGNS
ncbi:MAG: hypothetical protein Q7L55_08475 [Actinomycetota bacterium]|nr:hypothetical protein [Actinomycetota bacterium]